MARYLSDQWIADLDDAARTGAGLAEATSGIGVVIQQEVSDGPDEVVCWYVEIDHGSVRVSPGRRADPDITFSQDRETAVAVATGVLSAQTAFMVGRLRVGGDVGVLMAHHDALARVDDVFAGVRAGTEF